MKAATSSQLALWPAMYAPPVLGMAAALWLLAGWPLPWRRRGNDNGNGAGAAT